MRRMRRNARKLALRILRYTRSRQWLDAAIVGLVAPVLLLGLILGIKKSSVAIVDESIRQRNQMTMEGSEDASEHSDVSIDNQHDYDSLDLTVAAALRTPDILSSWKKLDPVVRGRIWSRTMYPTPRESSTSEEVELVLRRAKLDAEYKNTSHSFEMLSRTYEKNDLDAAKTFLREYKKCIKSGECSGYDFYEKIASNIHEIYTKPAIEVLTLGQCARAKYLLNDALELFDELELPVHAGVENVNQALLYSVLSQGGDCQIAITVLIRQGESSGSYEDEFTRFVGAFPSMKTYLLALELYRKGEFADAYQLLSEIPLSKAVISDMARLMQARCVFSATQRDGASEFGGTVQAKIILEDVKSKVTRSSLKGDVQEYLESIDESSEEGALP